MSGRKRGVRFRICGVCEEGVSIAVGSKSNAQTHMVDGHPYLCGFRRFFLDVESVESRMLVAASWLHVACEIIGQGLRRAPREAGSRNPLLRHRQVCKQQIPLKVIINHHHRRRHQPQRHSYNTSPTSPHYPQSWSSSMKIPSLYASCLANTLRQQTNTSSPAHPPNNTQLPHRQRPAIHLAHNILPLHSP